MPKVSNNILKASAEGNEKELRKIIKHSRKIKLRDNHNWTALHHAVVSQNVACVKLLLEQTKLNPQDECYEGCTPLLLACSLPSTPVEIVQEFLKRDKTLVEFMNNEMQSPLHLAVSNNRLDIVKILVENGADVNYMDLDDDTPLHIASSKLNYDIIEYLLYSGQCDTALKNDFNMNPFELIVHLYEIELLHAEHAENVELFLKCIDVLSDFTYDETLNPDNELFELRFKHWNKPLTNFIINKYFLNSSPNSQYFTNILLKYNSYVYSAYVLVHDSVKSMNDLNFVPTESEYTNIFNQLFIDFRDGFYEIIYEILSKGDYCFESIRNCSDLYVNSIDFQNLPIILSLLSQFNHNLNLLRHELVTSFCDQDRVDRKIKVLQILNAFTTFDDRLIDFPEEILSVCYQEMNDVDTFMDLFLPIYELQWMRLNKIMNINYVPSLKQLAVFNIRKIVFANYANYSNCLKLRMIGELPIPKPLKKCLIYDNNIL